MAQDRVHLVCKDGQVHFLPGPQKDQNQLLLQFNNVKGEMPQIMQKDGYSQQTTMISADFRQADVILQGNYNQQ